MKKIVLIIVMAMVAFAVGCNDLTPAQMQEWLAHTQDLSSKLDVLQEVSVTNTEALKTIGVVGDNTLEKVAKVNEEIDRVQPQIEAVADGISNVNLTGDTFTDWMASIQAANAASVPFNPWAVPIGGFLTLTTIIGGYFSTKRKKEAEAATAKNAAYKVGIEGTKAAMAAKAMTAPEVASLLYDNIGKARAAKGVV